MIASPTGARCGQHPDAAAVALCARCGGYLCGACTEVVGETAYCAPCAERRIQDTRPSRAVRLALLANVLGFLFLGAPVVQLSWSIYGKLGGVLEVLLELACTLAAAVAGTVISARKLRRRQEVGDRGFAIVLRVLSALNLLGLLAWGALTAFVLSLGPPMR
ncbi:hypothetical protein COCOR_00448 [Corallococcus coralloides DSM 2259]|uniref:B box-type domain-containing protein n=1 Tax=Corallococcus coralloides (strain ATCC 25202 / DSM 2259 / NBRC 100086 / M2) TaxID=1144275 RepID=H8N155_CORCM|nr:hypothetical protein [Corallococcus coralloides]AFE03497.1 hypothetical protein COCOR_00448 [Corallococcus coralloides DSM 2259]